MREELYRGKIITLERLGGKWEVIRHAGSVGILVTRGEAVLLVEQERPATGMSTWEVPAGLIDAGESPAEAARREAAEEVGLTGELKLIARFYTSPGYSDEETHLFALTAATETVAERDPGEELTPRWWDAREAWEAALTGRIATSSVTLIALRLALAELGVSG